jgi:hypothetical protein
MPLDTLAVEVDRRSEQFTADKIVHHESGDIALPGGR